MPLDEIAPGVSHFAVSIANVYMVGQPGRPWFIVDAGLPGKARDIQQAAMERYGSGSRPEYILLTQGHFDHSGSALQLANAWDIPIYVHPLELPFVTGKSPYPPKDATIGGAMAMLSRFFPSKPVDLRPRVKALPDDRQVPVSRPGSGFTHPDMRPVR